MSLEGERKRLAMAGATGAMEEDYRQGLAAHAARHNKVRVNLIRPARSCDSTRCWICTFFRIHELVSVRLFLFTGIEEADLGNAWVGIACTTLVVYYFS